VPALLRLKYLFIIKPKKDLLDTHPTKTSCDLPIINVFFHDRLNSCREGIHLPGLNLAPEMKMTAFKVVSWAESAQYWIKITTSCVSGKTNATVTD
jgi:hypothetical protein